MRSIIVGAGTYGEVYLSYLKEVGVEIIAFLDDDEKLWEKEIKGIPILGGIELLETLKNTHNIEAVYCPIGDNNIRVAYLMKAQKMGYEVPNFIHPKALISPSVAISKKGIYILPNTIIMPYVTIDDYVMISVGANIIHHTKLGKGVFVSNGVNLGANIDVKEYAYIGMGATIMTGVKIVGENSLIGASSNVIKDIEKGAIVAGNPAKVLRYKE